MQTGAETSIRQQGYGGIETGALEAPMPLPASNSQSFTALPTVELPAFSGPLDLLLKLIREHEIDIYDIPISVITDRYLAAIESIEYPDLKTAGDFFLMAATLLEIKSAMLLPPKPATEDEEPVDPRTELVQHLLEYQAYRAIAEEMSRLEKMRRLIFSRPFSSADLEGIEIAPPAPANLSLRTLNQALNRLLDRLAVDDPVTSIPRQLFSMRVRMGEILALVGQAGRADLEALLRPDLGRLYVIVSFLAILELLKSGRLDMDEMRGKVRLFQTSGAQSRAERYSNRRRVSSNA